MKLAPTQEQRLFSMRRSHALTCLLVGVALIIPALALNAVYDQLVQATIRTFNLGLTATAAYRVYRHGADDVSALLGISGAGIGTLLALSVLGGLHAPMAVPLIISFVAFSEASFGNRFRWGVVSVAIVAFVILAIIDVAGYGELVDHRLTDTTTMRSNQVVGLSITFGAILLYGYLQLRWLDLKSELLEEANERLAVDAQSLRDVQTKKDSLFSIVSHELRTPAATIHMLAENIEPTVENRQPILSATEHLLSVIDDLRTAINLDEAPRLQAVHFSITALVNQVERQVSSICSRNHIQLTTQLGLGGHDVFIADAYRLRSMLTNLIRNAAQHSMGTEISLWMGVEPLDHAQSRVTFVVDDNGKGIPEADRDRLFNPFERGDTSTPGTGVGLHIVKTWADAMGGLINIGKSTLGGASFTLTLTLPHGSIKSVGTKVNRPKNSIAQRMNGLSVLVVEDDAMINRLTRQLFTRNYSVHVIAAFDGEEALAQIAKQPVDLIVTDYFMPRLDGRALITQLRDGGITTPIIGVTAATIGGERNDLLAAGASAVAAKPLRIEALEPILAQIFDINDCPEDALQ